MIHLSFIIPAYNARKTILRTLDSIYDTSLACDCFEIIVIDDCSTDDTVEVIKNYSNERKNLRVLCQDKNHRQGAARNRGIKEARGEYIMFVDSDDSVEPGISTAVNQALLLGCDILCCGYLWMYSEHQGEKRLLCIENNRTFTGKEFCEQYYNTAINTCPISYLWRRDYLTQNDLLFIEDRRMEDYDFIEKSLYFASSIAYSNSIVYRVLSYGNINSTTHSFSYDTEADWIHVAYRRLNFCDSIYESSPLFCSKINEQSLSFVCDRLSFHHLLRLPKGSVRKMFIRLGRTERHYLITKNKWPFFTLICLVMPSFVSFVFDTEKTLVSLGNRLSKQQ